jgi:hypothetical protein
MTDDKHKLYAMHALSHLRNAMIAAKAGAPTLPALLVAEENVLRILFPAEEVEGYLSSSAAKVYGR